MIEATPLFTTQNTLTKELKQIARDCLAGKRLTKEQGLTLFNADLSFLGYLANKIRKRNINTLLILIETFTSSLPTFACSIVSFVRILSC